MPSLFDHSLRFDQPACLWLLLLAVPVALLGWRSLAALEPARRWTAVTLRLLVLLAIVLMLAGMQLVRRHADLTVVALLDTSESVQRALVPPESTPQGGEQASMEAWFDRWLEKAAARGRRDDDRFALVGFDGRPTVRSLPAATLDTRSGMAPQPEEGTDVAAAIRLGLALFPADSGKRLLLAWDGNSTAPVDDLMTAAREARAAGVPIDIVPIEYRATHEAMVQAVYAPAESRQGQTVAVRIVLTATQPTPGQLNLTRNGTSVDLSPNLDGQAMPVSAGDWVRQTGDAADPLAVSQFTCVKIVELPMPEPGAAKFEAVFTPADGLDRVAANNRAEGFTYVQGKGRILFVDNVAGVSGQILPQALRQRGIDLDIVNDSAVPSDMASLQRYDAIIFQNVPADRVSPSQRELIARYVNDLGGGFIMVGGPDSFGAGGWTNTPIDRILPLECQVPNQTMLPSGALVLVLDRSGSMASPVGGSNLTQQEVANEAAVQALATLYPQDLIGVVAFDNSAKVVVKLTPNQNPVMIANTIRSIQPGGGTMIFGGLVEAHRMLAPLRPEDAAVKHVILLTDGQSQDGNYIQLVRQMRSAGITLSTIGVGDSPDTSLLTQLAQMGGGNFYQVINPNNLPQVFIKEARTVRRNLIKEQPFQPRLVNTGSPIMAGLPAPPPMKGLVLTGAKADPRVFMPLVGPEDEPLFAHWQVGLGRAAAFTSDAHNRWAASWLNWNGYPDFWARVVRAIARPSSGRGFDLTTTMRGPELHVRLDAAGPTDSIADRSATAVIGRVLDPDGAIRTVALQQTGPGVFEATIPAPQPGSYIVNLFTQTPGAAPQVVIGGTTRPPGPELRTFASNRALLEQVAQIAGGRVLDAQSPPPDALFDHASVVPSSTLRPLWRTLLYWTLLLLLLDVAVRRIALDFDAMRQWALGRLDAVAGLFRTREVSGEATLAALKRRAQQVDSRLDSAASPAVPPPPVTPAKARFEAPATLDVADDFASAVGAAREEAPSAPLRRAPGPAGEGDATTSRLLDAKRRAQARMDPNNT